MYNRIDALAILRALAADASFSMVLYRIMQTLNTLPILKIFAPVVSKLNAVLCGAVIGCKAEFGPGFVIIHSVGVVINSKVVGGERVFVESGVVIGDEKGLTPVLGSNIFIGSGAKLFGGISIGDDVKIGANAVVNKDVCERNTVVGVPAVPVSKNNI